MSFLTQTSSFSMLAVEVGWDLQTKEFSQNPACLETAGVIHRFVRAQDNITLQYASNEDIIFNGSAVGTYIYNSCPELEFSMVKPISGSVIDEPFQLIAPNTKYPFNVFAWQTMPTVKISIYEISYTPAAGTIFGFDSVPTSWGQSFTRKLLAVGYMGRCTARHNKRPDIVAIECFRPKATIQGISLGILTTERCHWNFGDQRCKKVIPTFTGQILFDGGSNPKKFNMALTSAVDLNSIPLPNENFSKGSISFEGLNIPIAKASLTRTSSTTSTAVFDLLYDAPSHPSYTWNGRVATVIPGCTKSATMCTAWSNNVNFGGFGMLIPTYNPQFESGTQDV